jgi:DNA uptake protein ComE-like DNA-binding protein
MPTPAERKALLFLAGVIVLGASVRVVRAARDDGSSDMATRQALSRQLAAVDSARSRDSSRKGGRSDRRSRRPRGRLFTRSDSSVAGDSTRSVASGAGATRRLTVVRVRRDTTPQLTSPVDVDVASETDIERLPRVGPVLARRIVEDRTANGPFGSMEGFERVRGVGPGLAATLRDRVTFSGTARPSNAIVDLRLRGTSPPLKSRRREHRR